VKALIVYESMFGNTRCVAEAIAAGMEDLDAVEVVEAAAAPGILPSDVDLLVVGGPTHAFGLSRPATRRSASRWRGSGVTSIEVGVREWLDRLAPVDRPVSVATFDTRVRWPPVPGSAARAAMRVLRAKGCHPVDHRTFWVQGTPGPLREDEGERAHRWGAEVARRVSGRVPASLT
jgi:hypothetical protein